MPKSNSFVNEMASYSLKNFKNRSRSKIMPYVAKRINEKERRIIDGEASALLMSKNSSLTGVLSQSGGAT